MQIDIHVVKNWIKKSSELVILKKFLFSLSQLQNLNISLLFRLRDFKMLQQRDLLVLIAWRIIGSQESIRQTQINVVDAIGVTRSVISSL